MPTRPKVRWIGDGKEYEAVGVSAGFIAGVKKAIAKGGLIKSSIWIDSADHQSARFVDISELELCEPAEPVVLSRIN